MGSILSYSISSAIYLAMFYLGYKWLMADETRHRLNRTALLTFCLAALTLPAISPVVIGPENTLEGIAEINNIEIGLAPETEQPVKSTVPIILVIIYFSGIAICIASLAKDIFSLLRIIAGGTHETAGKYTIVISDDNNMAPFSWLNFIVINREDYTNHRHIMLLHEQCHTDMHHWADILFVQLTAIFQWYNPAAWLIRNELKTVHEYQADSYVLSAGVTARDYQMLLIKKAVGARFPSLANSLNHSNLKKRVTMMYKSKSSNAGIRALVVIPALVAGWFITNTPAIAAVTDTLSEATFSDKVTDNLSEPQTLADEADEEVFKKPDVLPKFPGGDAELMNFMIKNMRYPAEAAEKNIQGNVVVRFTVNKEGKVVNPTLIRKVDPLLDNEAIRIINKLPDFTPGKKDGKNVNCYYTLPISFKLPKNRK